MGLLVTGSALVGSLASSLFGWISDRLGGVASVTGTFSSGAVTLIAMALSPTYGLLLGAAFLNGFPNAWGNPATNALIAESIPAGERGFVTGVKQSGVQFSTFLAGMLLPLFTAWWSWRTAVLAFLVTPVIGLLAMTGRQRRRRRIGPAPHRDGPLPVAVTWTTWCGFFSALATSAIIGFIPLFANESMGWSEQSAGTLIAVMGLAGIVARLFWPRISERTIGDGRIVLYSP